MLVFSDSRITSIPTLLQFVLCLFFDDGFFGGFLFAAGFLDDRLFVGVGVVFAALGVRWDGVVVEHGVDGVSELTLGVAFDGGVEAVK